MRALALVTVLLMIGGCPHPAPPVPFPSPDGPTGVVDCAADAGGLPTTEDVCDNLFIVEGYACARCPGPSGCRDTVDMVYCVVGTCLSDKLCVAAASINTDGTAAAKRRIHKRRK
jgi:hypothetical protein